MEITPEQHARLSQLHCSFCNEPPPYDGLMVALEHHEDVPSVAICRTCTMLHAKHYIEREALIGMMLNQPAGQVH